MTLRHPLMFPRTRHHCVTLVLSVAVHWVHSCAVRVNVLVLRVPNSFHAASVAADPTSAATLCAVAACVHPCGSCYLAATVNVVSAIVAAVVDAPLGWDENVDLVPDQDIPSPGAHKTMALSHWQRSSHKKMHTKIERNSIRNHPLWHSLLINIIPYLSLNFFFKTKTKSYFFY